MWFILKIFVFSYVILSDSYVIITKIQSSVSFNTFYFLALFSHSFVSNYCYVQCILSEWMNKYSNRNFQDRSQDWERALLPPTTHRNIKSQGRIWLAFLGFPPFLKPRKWSTLIDWAQVTRSLLSEVGGSPLKSSSVGSRRRRGARQTRTTEVSYKGCCKQAFSIWALLACWWIQTLGDYW